MDAEQAATLGRAGQLAKFDLATTLVTEMTSLAGFVAREYALRKGEPRPVAEALYQMEQPRTTADALPASMPGALLALGDRFDLLMAMFALGAKPSGSSDPYGLRRAALGVVRILREDPALAGVSIRDGLAAAATALRAQGVEVSAEAVAAAEDFTIARFAQLMRDEGRSAEVIDLRSLAPIDWASVERSARKTGRVVVAHEAPRTCGLGAEIAARVQERCFFSLEAPVIRVTGLDMPYPPSRVEEDYVPGVDRILYAVDQSLAY